jgi:hypothetical protein
MFVPHQQPGHSLLVLVVAVEELEVPFLQQVPLTQLEQELELEEEAGLVIGGVAWGKCRLPIDEDMNGG